MSTKRPRFTILIPTVGRSDLLKSTLDGLLLQNHDDFEIVVSDNCSVDATQQVLKSFEARPRLRHVRTLRRLSMPNHWEFAMEHAKGEYVVILGDDDGLAPNALRVLDEVIARTNSNLISWRQAAYYHPDWPGTEANTLFVPTDCTGEIFAISAKRVLNDYQRFSHSLFPNLLRTCFSMELFSRAKNIAKTVFVAAPDYSCPALLLMDSLVKYVSIDSVIGIGGKSRISNASASVHSRSRKLTEYLRAYMAEFGDVDPFPHHEPKVWSSSNVLAASLSYARWHYPNVNIEAELNVLHIFKQTVGEIERRRGTVPKAHIRNFKNWLENLPVNLKNTLPNSYGVEALKVFLADLLKLPFQPVVKLLSLESRFWIFLIIKAMTKKKANFIWAQGENTRWFRLSAFQGFGNHDAMKLVENILVNSNIPRYSQNSPIRIID